MARNGADPSKLKVEPVEYVHPASEATQLSDAAERRFMENIRSSLGLEGEELRDAVKGVARRRFRRRIAGFSRHRKGAEGFSRDLDKVMRAHIGETMRYIARDRLKHDAINMMEKEGLSENRSSVQKRPQLALMVQQWFRDVNGQKQQSEEALDSLLNKSWMSPLKGAMAAGGATFLATEGFVAGGAAITGASVSVGAIAVPILLGGYVAYVVGKGMVRGGAFQTRGITDTMLGHMSHLKLGMFMNIMSPLVNLSQTALNTYPVLGAKQTGIGAKRFYNALLSRIRGKPNADWRTMERAGITSNVNFAEGTAHQFDKEGVLSKISMMNFTGLETFNRGVAYLGGLNQAQDRGDSPKDARVHARAVMKRTQLNYELAAKPEILRNNIARVPLQFKNYMVQQLAFVAGLRGAELARFMVSMTLMAGTLGLPGVDLLDWLTQLVTEKTTGKAFSPILAMKEEAIRAIGRGDMEGNIMTFLTRGVPGLMGVDMLGRIGMGDKFIPTELRDAEGPWVSFVTNAAALGARNARIWDHIRNLSPGLGNPPKVIEAFFNGGVMTSPWHDGLIEYEATPAQLVLKGLGGRPMREALAGDIRDIERHKMEQRSGEIKKYRDLIVQAERDGDSDKARRIMAEARAKGVRITGQSIRSALGRGAGDRMQRDLLRLPPDMRESGQEMREAVAGQ